MNYLEIVLAVIAAVLLVMLIVSFVLRKRFSFMLAVFPDFIGLVTGLYKDDRVPLRFKASLAGLMAYLASPVDLIPDFIPILGYLDDVIIIGVAFDAVINQIDTDIVNSHWHGDEQLLIMVSKVSSKVAAIVPKRLRKRIFGTKKE